MLEHVDARSPAGRGVHQPAQAQPERDREVDRVVGSERERGHAEAVDRRRREPRVVERAARRVGEHLGAVSPGAGWRV